MDWRCTTWSTDASVLYHSCRCRSVMTAPGSMALTRMLSGPNARASEWSGRPPRPWPSHRPPSPPRRTPGDRGEIDDRAEAQLLHVRMHGLGGKEMMAEVHVLGVVPIVGVTSATGWRLSLAALLTSTATGPSVARARDRGLEGGNVGHVAAQKKRRAAVAVRARALASSRCRSRNATRARLRRRRGQCRRRCRTRRR